MRRFVVFACLLSGCVAQVTTEKATCRPACELSRDPYVVSPDPIWILTLACCEPSQFKSQPAVGVCIPLDDAGGCR